MLAKFPSSSLTQQQGNLAGSCMIHFCHQQSPPALCVLHSHSGIPSLSDFIQTTDWVSAGEFEHVWLLSNLLSNILKAD